MSPAQKTNPTPLICVILALVTFFTFWHVQQNNFVNYDDPDYVTENVMVQKGLTGESVVWAFRANHASNWHPLTWMSHMMDCQMYGENPVGHHRTSLFLHAVNAVLLFLVLKKMTGAIWRSAVVAALFALHPMRVESVAWVSERKDVLSGFFWLLTMLFYARYTETRAQNRAASVNYALTLVCFALGLMSKPMLVTLPCVLLLLDIWPLNRSKILSSSAAKSFKGVPTTRSFSMSELLIEKVPFAVLTLIFSIVTVWAQKSGGSVRTLTDLPMASRINNALVSYIRYIEKSLWPDGLAVFYPLPEAWPGWAVIGALLFIGVITFCAFKFAKHLPYISMGWFWFLGTMVPVIGIVQVGIQSMADRYTYIPMIGVYIVVAWGVYQLMQKVPNARIILAAASAVVLGACIIVTRSQIVFWRDSEILFRHALAVTKDNYTAHQNLGILLAKQNKLDEAKQHFEAGLKIYPNVAESHHNMGNILLNLGQPDLALSEYLEAIRLKPDYDASYMNLGLLSVKQGRFKDAAGYYSKAVELKPEDCVAHYNLGTAYFELGQLADAETQYTKAISLQPAHVPSLYQMGRLSLRLGNRDRAVYNFSEVLRFQPDHAEAQAQLAQLR